MTQILILLLVVFFSLFLIGHGHKKRKISIVLFGVVLLFALPLSMYKQGDNFSDIDKDIAIDIDYSKEDIDIITDSQVINDKGLSSISDIDPGSIKEFSDKIFQISKDISNLKEDKDDGYNNVEDRVGIFTGLSSLVNEVIDFFEFIRGSNVAAVDLNTEDEVIVVGSNYANDKSQILEIHVIDVGQGDSMLIKKGELEILIDAGPNAQGEKLLRYLKGNFVKEIDLVIASHPHEDHIGGMDVVIDAISVKRVIDSGDSLDTKTYRDYMASVKASGAELIYDNNLVYDYGDVKVQIIELGDNYKNTNENSVVSVISYNGKNILAAGDLEENLEDELTQILRARNIKIDFYKASHHGSKTSNSKELLDYINPEVIAISAGRDNKYNHPNKKAMEAFLDNTSRIYSTHKSGNLKFTISDEIIESKDYYNLLITDSNDYR